MVDSLHATPEQPVRVRFAPSPTGYLHVGGARTALFNWLYARHTGGTFVLRIEDTDAARNTPAAVAAILDGLKWLGMDWDEGPEVGGDYGPYFQSQRQEIYDAYLEKLREAGRVYEEENGAVRFKFSRTPITIDDAVNGDIVFEATEEPDMTIRRPDGSYIFHFVNVIDDLTMKINLVIRGEDHISNTWKHIDLFHALGAKPPKYAHIPLILNDNGSKMSKRDAGSSVESYITGGFLPETVINYLSLLGWSPKDGSELLPVSELIQRFGFSGIQKHNAKFDLTKALWLNGEYLKTLPASRLWEAAKPFLSSLITSETSDEYGALVMDAVRTKTKTLTELPEWVHYFFGDAFAYEEDFLSSLPATTGDILQDLHSGFSEIDWTPEAQDLVISEAAAKHGLKSGKLMPILRAALSGQRRGPGIHEMLHILGKEKSLARILRLKETQFN